MYNGSIKSITMNNCNLKRDALCYTKIRQRKKSTLRLQYKNYRLIVSNCSTKYLVSNNKNMTY